MTTPPASPCIYHITHVDNLADIVAQGGLLNDTAMIQRGGPRVPIGMATIKGRRVSLPVACHPGLHVGDCVPFYFCPRSIMLNVIWYKNHPQLAYRGGQEPIVHLEADLNDVVAWANTNGRRWAFTLSNAGAAYTQFRDQLARLVDIDWDAVASTNFRPGVCTPSGTVVSEGKQAEFLLESDFPWHLVRTVGVHSPSIGQRVLLAISSATHKPPVLVQTSWYF